MTTQNLPPVRIGANNQRLPAAVAVDTGTLYEVPNDGAMVLIFAANAPGATLTIRRRVIGPDGVQASQFSELSPGADWVFGPFPPVVYGDSVGFSILTGAATVIPLQIPPKHTQHLSLIHI